MHSSGVRMVRAKVGIGSLLSKEGMEQNLPQKIDKVSVTSASLCRLSS